MEQAEYWVDKTGWGDGPWNTEPDRVDFVHAGFACIVLRHPHGGHYCGYCGVPREHPLYGKNYQESPEVSELQVHMGMNYSAACEGAICHVPAPGMPEDVWWFGCDFGHFQDLSPGMAAFERSVGLAPLRMELRPGVPFEIYRDLRYVRHEIEGLAEQLASLSPEKINGG